MMMGALAQLIEVRILENTTIHVGGHITNRGTMQIATLLQQ
jgi:hypothetical protein